MFCKVCGQESNESICTDCFKWPSNNENTSISFFGSIESTLNGDFSNVTCLDFFGSKITSVCFKNQKKLEKLRLSNCNCMQTSVLENLPSLLSVDYSGSENLTKVIVKDCPKIKSLDFSCCSKLNEIDGELLELEYLSISNTLISDLLYYPMLKFIDISATPIKSIGILQSSRYLQVLRMKDILIDNIDFGPFTYIPYLSTIESNCQIITFTNPSPSTSLVNLYFKGAKKVENIPISRNFNFVSECGSFGRGFSVPISSGDWVSSYRLLYGPYAQAPIDTPFSNGAHSPVVNYIVGSIMGSAICSSLSSHISTLSKDCFINYLLETHIDITWTHPQTNLSSVKIPKGSIPPWFKFIFINDTIFDSIIEGILHYNNEEFLRTKYSNSSIPLISSVLMSRLIRSGEKENWVQLPYLDIFKEILCNDSDAKIIEAISMYSLSDIINANLSPEIEALAVSSYVLRKGYSFSEGMESVFRAGGNINLNSIVVGAYLGALWGFRNIPKDLVYYFNSFSEMLSFALEILSQAGLSYTLPLEKEFTKLDTVHPVDQIQDPFCYQKFIDM